MGGRGGLDIKWNSPIQPSDSLMNTPTLWVANISAWRRSAFPSSKLTDLLNTRSEFPIHSLWPAAELLPQPLYVTSSCKSAIARTQRRGIRTRNAVGLSSLVDNGSTRSVMSTVTACAMCYCPHLYSSKLLQLAAKIRLPIQCRDSFTKHLKL